MTRKVRHAAITVHNYFCSRLLYNWSVKKLEFTLALLIQEVEVEIATNHLLNLRAKFLLTHNLGY